MPEKFPENPSKKAAAEKGVEKSLEITENREGDEKPRRYRTIENEILDEQKDGLGWIKTERALECNGLLHRRCVDKISYDEKGEVVFAEQISQEELRPCDCGHA